MLQKIRESMQGWLAGVVVAILVVPFAFWGVNSYFETNIGNFVAKIDDVEISQTEFTDAYQREYQDLRARWGDQFRPEMINEEALAEDVLDRLINTALIDKVTEDLGYRAADKQVLDYIFTQPYFLTDGEFDRNKYESFLAARGMTPRNFENLIRGDLQGQQVQRNVAVSGFVVPGQVDQIIALERETRRFSGLTVPAGKFWDEVEVTAEAQAQYYTDNLDQFMTEESINLAFVELNADELADEVVVTEEMLLDRYQQDAELYRDNEQRRARHIQLSGDEGDEAALAEAAEIETRLASGEDFGELAKEFSVDVGSASAGGELPWLQRGVLIGPFEDTLFAMQEGEISEPVKIGDDYHVIQLLEIRAPQPLPFEEVRDQIEQDLKREMIDEIFYERGEQLAELAFENRDSLALVSAEMGKEVQIIEGVTRTEGADIANDSLVRNTAFGEQVFDQRYNSDLVQIDAQRVVVLRIQEHFPPEARPLEEVKPEIEEQLRRELAEERARALADDIYARAEAGEDLEDLANENLLGYMQEMKIGREERSIARDLVEAIFELKPPVDGQPVLGRTETADSEFAVFKVHEVIPGSVDGMSDEALQARRAQYARQLSYFQMMAYLAELRRQYGVVINADNLLNR